MSMNKPDVDEILNYLSTKFNKIFNDREFICCVIEDLQTILNNKNKCYVVVFPVLGPLYLKAVRYHARVQDLAVFTIGAGKLKSVAVCHKEYLTKQSEQTKGYEVMSEGATRRKRPERQLYVPPAQRRGLPTSTASNKPPKQSTSTKKPCTAIFTINERQKQFESDSSVILRIINRITFSTSFTSNSIFSMFLLNLQVNHFRIDFLDKSVQAQLASLKSFSLESTCDGPISRPPVILRNDGVEELVEFFEDILLNYIELENGYKLECDKLCDRIVDLSLFNLGHYFNIVIDGSHYFYECQESHSPTICYNNHVDELQVQINSAKTRVLEISKPNNISAERGDETTNKKQENEHEQEKQIMRKAKENINRKSRPIMKYVDDLNDTLKIDKDSINNWEELFDDDGKIQDELLTEIVEKVGSDVTVIKAAEDYSAYTNKSMEDLEHVVELFSFPSSFETHDLVQAFQSINTDCMYVKWVDDTHALLVLGSLSQAQKAVSIQNPLIKVRPMTAASAISMNVANKSDLRPAIKRPQTNLQTARRLITTHLGKKSKATQEQLAKEKQDLKKAKELKKLIKQNEVDAWEGKLRSSVNS